MKTLLLKIWSEQEGVLTFEWILLVTVLVIGIVGGVAAVRDGVISELADVAEGVTHIDQGFVIPGNKCFNIRPTKFRDRPLRLEVTRQGGSPLGQGPVMDEKR